MPETNGEMWIVQISDPHLRPRGVLHRGVVDSNAALAATVRQINALHRRPDVVLLTGDIVDEGLPAEYSTAREILAELKAPLLLIPGNHDEPSAFRLAFSDHAYLPPEGPINYVADSLGPVRVIALDVTVPGRHHGEVDRAALEWLEAVLASAPDRPTILMMHQPPLTCGVPYLDAFRCRNAEPLSQIVSRFPTIERVLCGHVHRHMNTRFAGTQLCTAPSTATAIALRPYPNAEPASFVEPAGFLLHHWRPDDGIVTHSILVGSYPGPFPFA